MKILLVEDNAQLSKALVTLLKRNSYLTDSAYDGEEALRYIKEYQYDVIILDIMLPKVNGLEVLKQARNSGIKTPIIMLTAKSTIEDKILGLDYGADDYLSKPFNTEELLARIRALIRRNSKEFNNNEDIYFGDITLEKETFTIKCGNEKVSLSNKEFQILLLLINFNGRIVSVEEITNKAWEIDSAPIDANVWVFISYLRKKLESIGSKILIKSIRYQGYYLEYQKWLKS